MEIHEFRDPYAARRRSPEHLRKDGAISSRDEVAWLRREAQIQWMADNDIPWTIDELEERIATMGTARAMTAGLAAALAVKKAGSQVELR
ncbi:hypothetical protein D9V29_11795 [Mycetocola manganoxydans]|uniref:Uncharacterized protein n=2 Tax=Mycetocola manganoxydans TaxID=699879 RepID=A0A3L6ZNB7_9MICO|nr:hypothetical protein [Mycetocola manganoxydans]RLP69397.1 hypothetical protein D9V29_11795 [Mycetocola manganoxydans]